MRDVINGMRESFVCWFTGDEIDETELGNNWSVANEKAYRRGLKAGKKLSESAANLRERERVRTLDTPDGAGFLRTDWQGKS